MQYYVHELPTHSVGRYRQHKFLSHHLWHLDKRRYTTTITPLLDERKNWQMMGSLRIRVVALQQTRRLICKKKLPRCTADSCCLRGTGKKNELKKLAIATISTLMTWSSAATFFSSTLWQDPVQFCRHDPARVVLGSFGLFCDGGDCFSIDLRWWTRETKRRHRNGQDLK
jgi:hypothetical protein